MKKDSLALLSIMAFVAFLLAACSGDTTEVTNINQTGVDVVATVGDLPKCSAENEGEMAFVKGEPSARICVDGEWFATKSGDDSDFSCKTEELKDKSGLKIVCNGDSIGVVLNGEKGEAGEKGTDGKDGSDGEDGKAGSGCTISGKTDSTVTVKCGDSTMVLEIGGETGIDVLEPDSERIAVSLDSLAGYSQKGPFLKGSTVYLYELSDGRTLKQTNGNFTSMITRDDGRYKFTARDLASQYAMIVVEGNYRNEVTGEPSKSSIRLRAITDMRKHSDANINLLTHLEFDRVYYLVTREKMTVKKAKKQAQKEIFAQFNIAADDFEDSENLDVFGTSEADAALLAISILLQGDRNESELLTLLTAIGNDMEADGKWDEPSSDSLKAAIAIWTLNNHGNIETFRKNVEGWNLGPVPPFEKYIEKYADDALGAVDCSGKANGYTETVSKKYSPFNGKTFTCNDGVAVMARVENKYLNPDIQYGELVDPRDKRVYKTVQIGAQTWMAENLNYADSLAYPGLQDNSWCYNNDPKNCEIYGRFYEWSLAMDSVAVFSNDSKGCGNGPVCFPIPYQARGICPEGWHIPWIEDIRILAAFDPDFVSYQAKGVDKWPNAVDKYGFAALPMGYSSNKGTYFYTGEDARWWTAQDQSVAFSGNSNIGVFNIGKNGSIYPYYTWSRNAALAVRCVKNHKVEYGQLVDERDGNVYRTVKIGDKTWMAENLRYNYPGKTEELDSSSFCHYDYPGNCEKYGRLYLWSAAMDSAALFSENGKGCGNGVTCSPTYPVRGVCPKGWHFPDSTEWEDLLVAHGRSGAAYLAKDVSLMSNGNYNYVADVYGFSLMGGEGYVRADTAYYNSVSPNGFFSSQESGISYVRGGYLGSVSSDNRTFSVTLEKHSTHIVRCVQDD